MFRSTLAINLLISEPAPSAISRRIPFSRFDQRSFGFRRNPAYADRFRQAGDVRVITPSVHRSKPTFPRVQPGDIDRATVEWRSLLVLSGRQSAKQLGVHGYGVAGLEPESVGGLFTLNGLLTLTEMPDLGRQSPHENTTVLRMKFKTFINYLILVPCQLVRSGRQMILPRHDLFFGQPVFFRLDDLLT